MQTTTEVVNGRAVISLHGRFDFNAYRAFRTSCHAPLAATDVAELELNLERVEHLDRSALGMLLLLKARSAGAAGPRSEDFARVYRTIRRALRATRSSWRAPTPARSGGSAREATAPSERLSKPVVRCSRSPRRSALVSSPPAAPAGRSRSGRLTVTPDGTSPPPVRLRTRKGSP
jgi:hypothetical protein